MAFIFVFLGIFLQILAWYYLIKISVSENNKLFIDLIRGYALSFLPRYLPGSIWGYASRSEWLYQKFSISYKISNSVSIYELAATVTANLVFILLWLDITYSYENLFIRLILTILLPFLIWLIITRFIKLINYKKMNFLNIGIIEFTSIPLKHWFVSVFIFMVHWIFLSIGLIQLLLFLGNQTLNIFDSIFATCFSWLTGFLVFIVPAGIGFREFSLSFVLSDIFLINTTIVPITVILFRFLSILAEISWIFMKFTKKRNSN